MVSSPTDLQLRGTCSNSVLFSVAQLFSWLSALRCCWWQWEVLLLLVWWLPPLPNKTRCRSIWSLCCFASFTLLSSKYWESVWERILTPWCETWLFIYKPIVMMLTIMIYVFLLYYLIVVIFHRQVHIGKLALPESLYEVCLQCHNGCIFTSTYFNRETVLVHFLPFVDPPAINWTVWLLVFCSIWWRLLF